MLLRARRPISPSIVSLLAAQVPADFADWLDYVAIFALLAFTWKVDPYVFAFLAASMGLPYLLVGPVAGVVIDRSNLRTILVMSNLGRAAATACLALTWSWQALLVVVFLRSAADAFFTPAKQSAIQRLTDEGNRLSINGISHAINQTSKIAAPAVGGVLLIMFHSQQVFLLNAMISLTAAIVVATIRFPVLITNNDQPGSKVTEDFLSGWREVGCNPRLKAALLLMMLGFFAMFFHDTLIAPLTRQLGFGPAVFGYALTAVGCGGVLGSLLFGLGKIDGDPFLVISVSAFLAGCMLICLGLFENSQVDLSLSIFLAVFFLIGFGTAAMLVPLRTLIQTETDPEKMARVSALSEALNTSMILLAPLCGATLASFSGIGEVFVVGGVLIIATGAFAALCHRAYG